MNIECCQDYQLSLRSNPEKGLRGFCLISVSFQWIQYVSYGCLYVEYKKWYFPIHNQIKWTKDQMDKKKSKSV